MFNKFPAPRSQNKKEEAPPVRFTVLEWASLRGSPRAEPLCGSKKLFVCSHRVIELSWTKTWLKIGEQKTNEDVYLNWRSRLILKGVPEAGSEFEFSRSRYVTTSESFRIDSAQFSAA